ncbi:sensor histidine kinase [Clostridiales bacterium]|nr:sensor histidine kinase [Clostridiales bacterium]
MNSQRTKRKFLINVIIVLVLIYLLVVGCMTWYVANEKVRESSDYSQDKVENLARLLDKCQSDEESSAVVDGLNLAAADQVMDGCIQLWNTRDTMDSVMLYRASGQGGKAKLQPVKNPAHILSGWSQTEMNRTTIVLEDWFSKEQIARMRKLSNIEGCKIVGFEGTFCFQPISVQLFYRDSNEDLRETTFAAVKKAAGQQQKTIMLDWTTGIEPLDMKRWQMEDQSWAALEAAAKKMTPETPLDLINPENLGAYTCFTDQQDSVFSLMRTEFIKLDTGDYWLGVCIMNQPWLYAVSTMKWFYFLITLVCLLAGILLIGSYSRILDARFELEKRQRQMANAVAHEMKTPLGIIKNYGEVLSEEQDETRRKEYVETIIEEADSMNAMIVNMLDLSKMEAGIYPLELSMVSISELAERTLERLSVFMERKGIRVETQLKAEAMILADERLVGESLSNLLMNAAVYGEENGRIRLSAQHTEQNSVRISVYNKGETLDEEELERIWENFYRSDAARNKEKGGTGLGLAIVANTCLIHGGKYGCVNQKDGVEFWIEIPSQEEPLKENKRKRLSMFGSTKEGTDLSGFLYTLIGTGVWVMANAYVFLVMRHELHMAPGLPVIPWLISLIGWGLCVAGHYKMRALGKGIKAAVWICGVMIASVLIYTIFYESSRMRFIGFLVPAAGACGYIGVLSWTYGKAAQRFGKRRLAISIWITAAAQIFCMILYLWLAGFDPCVSLVGTWGNMMAGATLILMLINMALWHSFYQHCHKKLR